MEARVRRADGRGGGKCRAGWESRMEVGLEKGIGARRRGIGFSLLVKGALLNGCEVNFEGQRENRALAL